VGDEQWRKDMAGRAQTDGDEMAEYIAELECEIAEYREEYGEDVPDEMREKVDELKRSTREWHAEAASLDSVASPPHEAPR
jgi:hypothetical protein